MAGKERNYLQLIRFDKKIKESFAGRYLTNIRLVILVLIIILIGGLTSFLTLPRRLNPEVKIPIVIISTNLLGASPADVESLITIPLEEGLSTLTDLNTVTSTSSNSNSTITLEFASSVDTDDAVNDVQKAVNNVTDLPEDATAPRVTEIDFEDQTVYNFAIRSESDIASLMSFAGNLRDSLEKLSTVNRISLSGLYENEIRIEIKPEIVNQYGISISQISQSIRTSLASYPIGTIKTEKNVFSVSIDPEISTVEDLRNLQIKVQSSSIKLADIASVYISTSPDQQKAYLAEDMNPKQVVILSIYKASNADITTTVNGVKDTIKEMAAKENGKYEVIEITDYAKLINDQFNELATNFGITIFLVFIVLLIVLGLRQAVLASLTIPLSILISFIVMQISGISINFLSLFSLLLALGLLVDNAIVILSAVTSYYKSKRFSAEESGLLVYKDFFSPVWATTLTTVWAFLPLLLATGIIGEFIKTIPIVVSATLISSTMIAFYITIPIMMFILKPSIPKRIVALFYSIGALAFLIVGFLIVPKGIIFIPTLLIYLILLLTTFKFRNKLVGKLKLSDRQRNAYSRTKIIADRGLIQFDLITQKYYRALGSIIHSRKGRKKTLIAVVIFSIFSYLLLPLGLIKNEFFPASPSDELYVAIDFPDGTNQDFIEKEAKRLSGIIQEHPDIKFVTTQYGAGQEAFSIAGDLTLTVSLIDESLRDNDSIQISQELRDAFSNYPNGNLSVVEISGGPPVGDDILITILGTDLQELDSIADKVADFMNKQPGITNVDKSIKPGIGKIVFVPDVKKLNDYGLTTDAIGFTMRSYLGGTSPDDLRMDNENIPIQIRIEGQNTPQVLNYLNIPTQSGDTPLLELGNLTLKQNPTQINREEQKRSVSIGGSVIPGYNIPEENQRILNFAQNLNLPDGYELKTGGVNEENQNSINSILQAMVASAILILITIVIQLGSFRKALVVMLVIPLAVSGVFIIFALFGIPLSFPALIGLLALFGIVVNNSIVMIHTINQNLNNKISFTKSIVDGASSRLEPIFLTSLTTIIGLIPITLSDPLWRGLGGAIIAGLVFSGAIMLFFIPVVYYLIYSNEYIKRR